MNHGYSYQATLTASQAVNWRIEDIIGGPHRLDFAKPFMPEALASVEPLTDSLYGERGRGKARSDERAESQKRNFPHVLQFLP